MGSTAEIRLPFPPSVNGLFANRKVKGRRGRVPTPEYEAWRTAAGYDLNRQHPRLVPGPVFLHLSFEDKSGRKPDLDNLAKAPIDLLVKHKVIDGDHPSIVRRITLEWDSKTKGCRVAIAAAGEGA